MSRSITVTLPVPDRKTIALAKKIAEQKDSEPPSAEQVQALARAIVSLNEYCEGLHKALTVLTKNVVFRPK
jgi:hypothetical protein